MRVQTLDFAVRDDETRDRIIIDQVVSQNLYQFPDDMTEQVVLDIGGHIGGVALMCANRGATVWTFEPERDTYRWLLENIENNQTRGKVIPFNIAIGKTGMRQLYHHQQEHGVASFYPAISSLTSDYELVWTVSFETVLRRVGKVDWVKLDCEGAEIEILPDILEGIFRHIPHLLVEFHQSDVAMEGWVARLAEFYHVTPLSHVEYSFQRS